MDWVDVQYSVHSPPPFNKLLNEDFPLHVIVSLQKVAKNRTEKAAAPPIHGRIPISNKHVKQLP